MSTNVAKPVKVAIIGASGTYGKGILGRAEEELDHLPEAERLAGSRAFSSTVRYAWGALCLAHMGRTTEAHAQLSKHLKELNLSGDEDETPPPMLVTLLECAVLVKDRQVVLPGLVLDQVVVPVAAAEEVLTHPLGIR